MGLKVDYEKTGVRYEALKEGFGIPLHTHNSRDTYHDVECLQGQVFIWGQSPNGSWWSKKLSPGSKESSYDPSLPHAVGSIGPASWFNAYRSCAEPEECVNMREDEKHTVLNSKCDVPDWVLSEQAGA